MRKRIGSLLLALILAANLSAWAAADSITQLDPAPTTPTDDPFPTVQSSIAFMYHGVRRSHVGDATTGRYRGRRSQICLGRQSEWTCWDDHPQCRWNLVIQNGQ